MEFKAFNEANHFIMRAINKLKQASISEDADIVHSLLVDASNLIDDAMGEITDSE